LGAREGMAPGGGVAVGSFCAGAGFGVVWRAVRGERGRCHSTDWMAARRRAAGVGRWAGGVDMGPPSVDLVEAHGPPRALNKYTIQIHNILLKSFDGMSLV